MSSHREAPEIGKDPVADNTDVYAFVSPDQPDTVTIITNYIPLEGPDGGPNFYEFGENVLYEIHVDNNGDGQAELTFQFQFHTTVRNPDTFLYNTGPITSVVSTNWNRFQTYSVAWVDGPGNRTVLADGLLTPPCNIGPRSTPNYATALALPATYQLPGGVKVFAGQRAEGFYVDLGAIFDLADLRPFQNLHLIPTPAALGVNGTNGFNVHTIAIQVPKRLLTRDGSNPTNPADSRAVIGVWGSASRRKVEIRGGGLFTDPEPYLETGPWVQVSRLGNPLINEVIIPMSKKDRWNGARPQNDSMFLEYYQYPELAKLLPVLYPGVFPHLASISGPRADLVAILLTGLPSGIIPGFQNYSGPTQADELRLNLAIPPASKPNIYGILGGDLAGFPNGRRVFDDVVTIELRAVAGATYGLVNPSYKPDGAASLINEGLSPSSVSAPYLSMFPYLGVPFDGFNVPPFPTTPSDTSKPADTVGSTR